jgi:hypothetical protein
MVVKMIQACLCLLAVVILGMYGVIGAHFFMSQFSLGGYTFDQLMNIGIFIYLLLKLTVIVLIARHWIDTGELLEQLKRVEHGGGKDSFNQIISQLSRDK